MDDRYAQQSEVLVLFFLKPFVENMQISILLSPDWRQRCSKQRYGSIVQRLLWLSYLQTRKRPQYTILFQHLSPRFAGLTLTLCPELRKFGPAQCPKICRLDSKPVH